MRRLIASLVAGGMLLFGLAPAGADAGGNMSNAACTALQESNPFFFDIVFESHGDCVQKGRTLVVGSCKTDSYLSRTAERASAISEGWACDP